MKELTINEIIDAINNRNSIDQDMFNNVKISNIILPNIEDLVYSIQDSLFMNVIFDSVALNKMTLSGSKFKNCIFQNCQLVKSDFVGTHFESVIFNECSLFRSNFIDATIKKSVFNACEMSNMILTKTLLDNTILKGTSLPLIKDNFESNVVWDMNVTS